jgi:amino acid transporter
MLFDGGRTGLLPAWLGRVREPSETPVNALLLMACGGLSIIAIWWLAHIVGADTGSTNPVGLYAECSTMGTIVILFVYVLVMLSLPFFIWRRHRERFSAVRHVGIPALGALVLVIPFAELFRPGQPVPYSLFPYIAMAIAVAAMAIAWVVVHRHPSTGSGEGTEFTES